MTFSSGYSYYFDPWHALKSVRKQVIKALKGLPETQRNALLDLSSRFLRHLYYSLELSGGHVQVFLEHIFSFFLHIQNIHEWSAGNFTNYLHLSNTTLLDKKFSHVFSCCHSYLDPNRPRIDSASPEFPTILKIVQNKTFLDDRTFEVWKFHLFFSRVFIMSASAVVPKGYFLVDPTWSAEQ